MGCLLIYHEKQDQCRYTKKAQIYMSSGEVSFFGFKYHMYLMAHQEMSNLSKALQCW